MCYLINTIELFPLNDFIKISNRMKELAINFTIRFILFPIELLIILVKDMRNSNWTGWYFHKISNLLIPHNNKTILPCWWQVFVLVELLLCSLRTQFRIFQTKCIKLGSRLLGLRLWNVRTDNVLVLIDRFQERFGILYWFNNMRRVQEVVNVMKYISCLCWLILQPDIFAVW